MAVKASSGGDRVLTEDNFGQLGLFETGQLLNLVDGKVKPLPLQNQRFESLPVNTSATQGSQP